MAALPPAPLNIDRYVVIHVATTCDEHGVYVTKDSAEVIEIGWILVDAKTLDEVGYFPVPARMNVAAWHDCLATARSSKLILRLLLIAASRKCSGQAHQHPHYPSVQYVRCLWFLVYGYLTPV